MKSLRGMGLVLVGIVIGACAHTVAPLLVARAGAPHHCDYTYITDAGDPAIGTLGKIEYDEDWERVLTAGFHLKQVDGYRYIFEKCQ